MECEAYACGKGTEGQLGREELYIGCPVPSPVSTLRRIVKITAGTSHCLALTDKGEIYAWGSGTGYKLGCANQQDEPIPIKLEFEQFMIDIAVGQNHSVAVDERGLVHTWGSGREGQLGYVVVKEDKTPKCLSSTCFDGHIMTKCFANSCYTYALSGIVYNWGWGGGYRLGHGDERQRLTPTKLEYFAKQKLRVLDIACGWRHVLAKCSDGNVYSWGSNSSGQLGLGDYSSRQIPTKIQNLADIQQICCGDYFSMALSTSGTVYCWGSGESGQSEPDQTTPIVVETLMIQTKMIRSISAGARHAMAISDTGEVFSWGCGTEGQLGHLLGNEEDKNPLPTRVEIDIPIKKVFCGRENTFLVREHAPYIDVMPSTIVQDMKQLMKGVTPRNVTLVYGPIEIDVHKSVLVARSRTISKLETIPSRINLETFLRESVSLNQVQATLRAVVEIMYTNQTLYQNTVSQWLDVLQINTNTYTSDLKRIINDYESHDVRIEMNSELILYAHRDILSCRCELFRAMLSSQLKEKDGIVELGQDDFSTISDYEKMIQFIYTDDIDLVVDDRASVFSILKLADQFGLERLKQLCEKFIAQNMNNDWKSLIEFCKLHNAKQLYEYCLYHVHKESGGAEKVVTPTMRATRKIVPKSVVESIKKHYNAAKLSSLRRRQSLQAVSNTVFRVGKRLIVFLLFVIFYVPFSAGVMGYGLFLKLVDRWVFGEY